MIETENCSSNNGGVCNVCCTRLNNVNVVLGGNRILEQINLHIHCGQLTAVIGPNGAGKSTLLKTILGEIPFTGEIQSSMSHQKGYRDIVTGYVPQRLEFDRTSPVTTLDLFSASRSGRPIWLGHARRVKIEASDALGVVDGRHLINKRLGTLSGGQLQRVLLALALTPVPDLLLLDEPVAGLDPSGIELFYRMVSDLLKKYHMAILMISHDISAAARYADRMLFLNRSILCDGSPTEVLGNKQVIQTFGQITISGSSISDNQ